MKPTEHEKLKRRQSEARAGNSDSSVAKGTTTMKFLNLLHQRGALLRQARLANLAFTYQQLGDFVARIARAKLRGEVTLSLADPDADRLWPVLLAHESSQAVIEEHFTDEDIVELADILEFLDADNGATDFTFRIEELESRFMPGLRRELEKAGVALEHEARANEDSNRGHG
jgi:hypothetical protein